ncbi:MAG: TauD/TfdA family dioxygenase [Pirellulales bacterium]
MLSTPLQVSAQTLPHQQSYAQQPFPLVLVCEDDTIDVADAVAWIEQQRRELLERADVCGAILFRGFPLESAADFDRFIAAFDLPNFPYNESLSNAVRVNRTERVFTANEAPASINIFLHHEMAQTPIYPSRLFFFCEQPATSGGATPICRSDIVWERLVAMAPDFARDCETKGLRYSNVMPGENDLTSGMGRSWQSTLRAATRAEAEARLAALDYTCQWLEDGSLRATTPVLAGVRDVGGGRKSFFNQLIAAFQGWKDQRNDPSKAITFGDGSPLDRATVDEVTRIAGELCFDIPWQRGDVALVNNYLVMHGRRSFEGTRKVLASLVG